MIGYHGNKKILNEVPSARANLLQRLIDARALKTRELVGKISTLLRQEQVTFTAVDFASLLGDKAFTNQLLQNAGERLFRDAQNVKQIGNAEPGMTSNEVDHTMVGTSIAEPCEQLVRIAGEIAIGKEEKLDIFHQIGRLGRTRIR